MRISDWSSDVCSSDLSRIDAQRSGLDDLAPNELVYGRTGFTFINAAFAYTRPGGKIGRASCRERVCQYVSISVVAVSLKQKYYTKTINVNSCHTPHTLQYIEKATDSKIYHNTS